MSEAADNKHKQQQNVVKERESIIEKLCEEFDRFLIFLGNK